MDQVQGDAPFESEHHQLLAECYVVDAQALELLAHEAPLAVTVSPFDPDAAIFEANTLLADCENLITVSKRALELGEIRLTRELNHRYLRDLAHIEATQRMIDEDEAEDIANGA